MSNLAFPPFKTVTNVLQNIPRDACFSAFVEGPKEDDYKKMAVFLTYQTRECGQCQQQ